MSVPFETVAPRMPTAPQRYERLPQHACDTHAHIFGPYLRFPLAHASSYAPPLAPAELHLRMLDTIGAARGVLVQPAPYGQDAAPMLAAIAASGGRLRGVCVADAATPERELQRLHDGGVRGLRFVEVRDPQGQPYAGSVGVDQLLLMAPAMRRIGLHAQLWAPCADYPRLLAQLAPLNLPLVLDHMASLKVDAGVDGADFTALLDWIERFDAGQLWLKLSVCRVSNAAPDYADLRPFHDALVARHSGRLLWGSDWPFVRMGERSPDVGQLLDLFHDWVPDAATRRRILVDNPAALYGYP